jgi:ATP/maltotriose-dependent transcriptional regulator MalT
LSGADLDRLADALFWLDELEESVAARAAAFKRYEGDGRLDEAAMAAWRVFYEHWLVGETVVGRSWLERCRRLIADPESAGAGWLAIADADVAMSEGRLEEAVDWAETSVLIGDRTGDPDLLSMGLQALGRAEIIDGRAAAGVGRLDRAMIMVIGNELTPLYTGWVYCNVIATCHSIADLRRANEWSEAALKWCETLREGRLYPGLCRVYAAELAALRGDWSDADQQARDACELLLAHDERYAGAAHYMVGELARLRGRFDDAEEYYRRAHRLGCLPQPGLGLVMLARGEVEAAVGSLRSALDPGPGAPLPTAQLLAGLVEAGVAAHDADAVALGVGRLEELATGERSGAVAALAGSARAWGAAWRGDLAAATEGMRRALAEFHDLQMPYEAARERTRIAIVAERMGDDVTAQLEFDAALDAFRRLGAEWDASLIEKRQGGGGSLPLTDREIEVVRLVAGGLTNRQVAAELFLSEHTVARHLGNIYTKLGIGSRAAATAWAYDHDLINSRLDGQN